MAEKTSKKTTNDKSIFDKKKKKPGKKNNLPDYKLMNTRNKKSE